MAFLASRSYKGYGSYKDVLGDTRSPAMIVLITAKDKPELITEISLSYAQWSLAAVNTLGCFGRIQVLSAQPGNPDDYPDPLAFVPDSSAALDQSIREQGFISLNLAEPIEIPAGQTYAIILSAAYLAGDVVNVPSSTLASLTIRGRIKGGNVRLETY